MTVDPVDAMVKEVSKDRQRAINAIRVLNRRLMFLKDLETKRPLTTAQTEVRCSRRNLYLGGVILYIYILSVYRPINLIITNLDGILWRYPRAYNEPILKTVVEWELMVINNTHCNDFCSQSRCFKKQ